MNYLIGFIIWLIVSFGIACLFGKMVSMRGPEKRILNKEREDHGINKRTTH